MSCSRKNVVVLESRPTETGDMDTETSDTTTIVPNTDIDTIDTSTVDTSTSDTSSDTTSDTLTDTSSDTTSDTSSDTTSDTSSDTEIPDRLSNLPYILGADVSLLLEDEAAGALYFDEGVQKDIFEILKDHRFNFAKTWILVDPAARDGYSENLNEAYGDLDHLLTLATRIKAAEMGLMVSFHCSNKGGDADTQTKPSVWEGHDFPTLVQDIYTHTHDTILALIDNGTRPDIVQIGNEIAIGIVLPDGSVDTPESFGALLSSAIQGVRDADNTIPVALHHPRGRNNDEMIEWLEILKSQSVDFDIIGASTWAEVEPGRYLANFTDLSTRYPEYHFLSLLHSADDIEVIHDVMPQIPDGRGKGAFLYTTSRVLSSDSAIFDVEDSSYDDETGGFGGNYHTNDYIELYPPVAERMGL